MLFTPASTRCTRAARARRCTSPGSPRGSAAPAGPGHFDGVTTVVDQAVLHRRRRAAPTSAGRTRSSSRWSGGWPPTSTCRSTVVGCPLVREPDGLALSSRNAYLTADERAAATILSGAAVHGVGGGGRRPARRRRRPRSCSPTPSPTSRWCASTTPRSSTPPTLEPIDEIDRRHAGCTGRVRGQGSSDRQRHDHVPRRDPLPRPRRAHRIVRKYGGSVMQRIMMKSKIHRATVTGADLNYVGSITLDPRLMELADIREHEQVHVLDIDNGARFETYVDPGWAGRRHPQRRRRPARAPGRQGHRHHLRAVRRGRARGLRAASSCTSTSTTNRPCTRSARSRRNAADRPRVPSLMPVPTDRPPRPRQRRRRPLRRGPRPARGTVGHRAHQGRARLVRDPLRAGRGGRRARPYDDDSPELHGSDTLAAGAGLCDTDAVRVLASEGPDRVRELIALGAHFDRVDGSRRAAPGRGRAATPSPRVVHAGGDATGAEIERALVGRGPGVRRRRPRRLVGVRPARRGRPRRRCARDRDPTAPSERAGPPRRHRDGRRGAVLRRHHQPGAVDRRRHRHGHACRRRRRRPRVHAVPPDRAAPPVDAAAAALRGAAR